jgi:hypothetical protein
MRPWSIALVGLAAAGGVHAQEAVEKDSRFVLHGYLSQSFAVSDGNQVLGIPENGTWDYRTAALQLRATVSPNDAFVVQLSQERLGDSPVMEVRNEIDLGWIFYERRLSDAVSARLGKVKTPIGIYNEIRYVGPLLPFFRVADAYYGEGSYTFDSMNGVVLSSRWLGGRRFSIDADAYAGEWRLLQIDFVTHARAKRGVGGQLWLNTPVGGLRAGIGGHRATWENSFASPPGSRITHERWAASLDANAPRYRLNAEFAKEYFDGNVFTAGYLLGTWRITDKLGVSLQTSRSRLSLGSFRFDEELTRDHAVGLSYAFRSDLVLKMENHWARGRMFDETEFATNLLTPVLRADYLIVSLSTLF